MNIFQSHGSRNESGLTSFSITVMTQFWWNLASLNREVFCVTNIVGT